MLFRVFALCMACLVLSTAAYAGDDGALAIENRWAEIRYVLKDKQARLDSARELVPQSKAFLEQHANSPAALTWHALAILLEAEIRGDISALGIAKEAKALLEQAAKNDAAPEDVNIHTTLGALYNEVPGWPIGFGDDAKARTEFAKALAIEPDGMEANYFYGDYLVQKGKYRDALPYLEKALAVPPRPGHERADSGRHGEVEEALALARKKLK
jgi:tetratricopeptide (TPR) repeat protein